MVILARTESGHVDSTTTFTSADIYKFKHKVHLMCSGREIITDTFHAIKARYNVVKYIPYYSNSVECDFIYLSPEQRDIAVYAPLVDEPNNLVYACGAVVLLKSIN